MEFSSSLIEALGVKYRLVSLYAVIFLSACVHEYILTIAFGYFYPVLFLQFAILGCEWPLDIEVKTLVIFFQSFPCWFFLNARRTTRSTSSFGRRYSSDLECKCVCIRSNGTPDRIVLEPWYVAFSSRLEKFALFIAYWCFRMACGIISFLDRFFVVTQLNKDLSLNGRLPRTKTKGWARSTDDQWMFKEQ